MKAIRQTVKRVDALGQGVSTVEDVQEHWHVLNEEQPNQAMALLGVKTLAEARSAQLRGLANLLHVIAAQQVPAAGKERPHGA